MKLLKILLCGLLLALPVFAEESEDRQTATSLHYVSHELDTRQNKLSTGTNAALTYTNTAGNIEQRTVKANLNGGTTDTSLPMVNAVNAGLNTKQNDIATIDDHTAVTYTNSVGTIGQKGIYQTDGTYAEQSDNLIDAKTFNAALKNGLDNEFVCADRPDAYAPGTTTCWLWEIHNTTTDNTLLPPGYTPVAYIEGTGTQYIDTGITPNNDTSVEMKAQLYSTTGVRFFATYANSSQPPYYGVGFSGSGKWVNQTNTINQITNINSDSNLHTVYKDKYTLYVDGIKMDDTGSGNFTTNGSLFLLAANIGNSASFVTTGKLYYAKIWNDNTLVRNLIPAIQDSDGKIGMYDTVSGEFFPNATTRGPDFTAGDPINNIVYIPQNQQ